MINKCFKLGAMALFLFNITLTDLFAEGAKGEELSALKTQVQELLKRIDKIEAQQANDKEEAKRAKEELSKVKEVPQTVQSGRVDLEKITSKLKMKGRAGFGFFDSGKAGSYPAGSFEMPDAKLQFSFQPDEINTVTMRFNLNNATAQSPLLDYFFLSSKDFISALKDSPFSLAARLGRFKLGFGEESWSDNMVESVLPSKSAGGVSVLDEGLEFAGKIKLEKFNLKPLGWVFSVSDGNSGVGADSTAGKAVMAKLYNSPIEPLYVSTSYYNSGRLDSSSSEMSIAGLITPPSGESDWDRSIWEVDARYDFGKGKKPLDPPVYSDSKAILRLSYGQYKDDANKTRSGNFGFTEGTYNWTKKFYTAARYSFVNIDGDGTATLNSITAVNGYTRFSLGAGYHWTDATILKLSCDWNKNSGPGRDDADDNLTSAALVTQF